MIGSEKEPRRARGRRRQVRASSRRRTFPRGRELARGRPAVTNNCVATSMPEADEVFRFAVFLNLVCSVCGPFKAVWGRPDRSSKPAEVLEVTEEDIQEANTKADEAAPPGQEAAQQMMQYFSGQPLIFNWSAWGKLLIARVASSDGVCNGWLRVRLGMTGYPQLLVRLLALMRRLRSLKFSSLLRRPKHGKPWQFKRTARRMNRDRKSHPPRRGQGNVGGRPTNRLSPAALTFNFFFSVLRTALPSSSS